MGENIHGEEEEEEENNELISHCVGTFHSSGGLLVLDGEGKQPSESV